MKLRKEDLDWAAGEGLIDRAQVDPLWEALTARQREAHAADAPSAAPAPSQRFELVNVAYYFGALIVIGAMGFFMNLGWERFGGGGIFVIAAAYAGVFVAAGRWLLRRPETRVPGGLLVTMAVCMTPLAMYGLERATGVWPTDSPGDFRDFHVYIRSGWLWMELATVVTSLVALRFVRFPFLTAPLAFVFWYMSMDLAPLVVGHLPIDDERQIVSIVVGLVMLGAAFFMDRRTPEDYSFWGYLFGMMAFWGGMSSMSSGSELNKLLYCMVNVGLIVVSPLLERRVFVVFGALGVFGYLGYLSYEVFKDSLIFPFALSFLGLAVLAAAVGYARNGGVVDAWIVDKTPEGLVKVLPRSRKAKA